MIFTYNNQKYDVEIVRKNNKNTYIRIKNDHIYITTSYFTTKYDIKKLLDNNRKSIEKMIDKSNKKEFQKSIFKILGNPYDVIIDNSKKFSINKENRIIITPNKEYLEKVLRNYAKTIFYNHLMKQYQLFEEKIPTPTLRIRKMTSRWGVCNTKTHNITLNLELIHLNIECLDYVIVHELSHLIEPNHSRAFWNIVSKYYPNYKQIRKEMRESC